MECSSLSTFLVLERLKLVFYLSTNDLPVATVPASQCPDGRENKHQEEGNVGDEEFRPGAVFPLEAAVWLILRRLVIRPDDLLIEPRDPFIWFKGQNPTQTLKPLQKSAKQLFLGSPDCCCPSLPAPQTTPKHSLDLRLSQVVLDKNTRHVEGKSVRIIVRRLRVAALLHRLPTEQTVVALGVVVLVDGHREAADALIAAGYPLGDLYPIPDRVILPCLKMAVNTSPD